MPKRVLPAETLFEQGIRESGVKPYREEPEYLRGSMEGYRLRKFDETLTLSTEAQEKIATSLKTRARVEAGKELRRLGEATRVLAAK